MFFRVCVFRVRVWKSYRTHSSFGYGYGILTELTDVPGRYTNVVLVPVPAPGYFYKGIPVPWILCHGRTELTEVPGTGKNVVQSLHKFRVRVIPRVWFHLQKFRERVCKSYRTHR